MTEDAIITIISRVRSQANKYIEEQLSLVDTNDMVTSHGTILGALFSSGGKLMMKDIAEKIRRDKSTVTYLVNKLLKEGYVKEEQCEIDSRIKYIILTKKGWEFKEKYDQISKNLLDKVYHGFNQGQKKVLIDLLLKILDNFQDGD